MFPMPHIKAAHVLEFVLFRSRELGPPVWGAQLYVPKTTSSDLKCAFMLTGWKKDWWYVWSAYRVPVFATGHLYVSSSLTTSTGSRSIVRMCVSSTSEIENTASSHGFTSSGTKLCCIAEYQLGSACMVYMSSLIVNLCLYSG